MKNLLIDCALAALCLVGSFAAYCLFVALIERMARG